ncbi:hypothetical protein BZG01_05335 [Labilibaculum manganireducens]|uniref:Tail specific protease domain-containing protein n=1 Tax=Labilibaculum manganireducens TaxID=1940525 RepID=A0A2N3ICZ3_9BACT|nr:S41 family peptidase [Labilibaculum manganireducens]PKQ68170.1 hypothetical protein BZG01_05335 [Labilibaculum manganireducens]
MKNFILLSFVFLITYNACSQKYTPYYFSNVEIINDLQFLKEKCTSIHPKFLDENFSKSWSNTYDSILNTLPDSISITDSFVLMAKLLSGIEDTHTGFNFPIEERQKYMFNGGLCMPFTILVKNNKLFFNQYFSKDPNIQLSDVEIVSINAIDSQKILSDLRSIVGVKNRECGDHAVEMFFNMGFWILYGESEKYLIQTVSSDSILTAKALTNEQYFSLKNQYPNPQQNQYKLEFSANRKVAYLSIKSFLGDDNFYTFLSNSFDSIKQKECSALIIDVKNNPGGRSRAVDSLLNYLTNKPYRQYASIGIRVSDEIKTLYKTKNQHLYSIINQLNEDVIYSFNDSALLHIPNPKKSLFEGDVFVTINERTNSAAATFAGVVKEKKLGKIVGHKPTGEHLKYYGDYLSFKLPHTKFEFFVSPKEFIQYGGTNYNTGVKPDTSTLP